MSKIPVTARMCAQAAEFCDVKIEKKIVHRLNKCLDKGSGDDVKQLKVWVENLVFMDPCIVDDSVEVPTRCSFVIEFIIPKSIEGSGCFEWYTSHHQEL
jgi:hypothetical protein